MNRLHTLLAALLLVFSTSCSDNDAAISSSPSINFDYSIDDITGIWQTSEMLLDASQTWVYTSDDLYSVFSFDVRFNSDYSYSLTSITSTESGTYTASGSIISTYINGSLQGEYDIQSLNNDDMTITLVKGTVATDYKLNKRW